MCVDYRQLNQMTIKDAYPLLRIEEIFTSVHNEYRFVSLDLLTGYHQIPLRAKHRRKTAFLTHNGLYDFKVMQFGLCNAPATFQQTLVYILVDQSYSKAKRKRSSIRSFTVKYSLLPNAPTPAMNANCWQSVKLRHLLSLSAGQGIYPTDRSCCTVRDFPFPSEFNNSCREVAPGPATGLHSLHSHVRF